MIEETSKDFASYDNVKLLCRDAEKLEFPENAFDDVFCGFGVFFFPNALGALQEFYRVLKPGGKLFISTWGEDDHCKTIFNEVYNGFGPRTKTVLHNFDNTDFIFDILSKSGFGEIKTIPDELDTVYPTFEDWFSSLWTHASRAKLETLNSEQLVRLKESLNLKLSPYLQSDGLHELRRAYYTRAVKPIE